MMRLVRSAGLPPAFTLLTSGATAHAECAWVMWVNTLTERIDDYSVDSAHSTRQECDEGVVRAARVLKQRGYEVAGGFPRSL